MSDEKGYSLCVKVEEDLAKEFHIEVVNQHGQAYGNTGNCLIEAIKLWVEKAKEKRIQKEKSAKK